MPLGFGWLTSLARRSLPARAGDATPPSAGLGSLRTLAESRSTRGARLRLLRCTTSLVRRLTDPEYPQHEHQYLAKPSIPLQIFPNVDRMVRASRGMGQQPLSMPSQISSCGLTM